MFAQALLSSIAILFVFLLGKKLVSPLAGGVGAWWIAVDPDQILAVADLNVHGFYSLTLLVLAAAAVAWVERDEPRWSAFLGLMLATSLFCRSAHFLLPVLL